MSGITTFVFNTLSAALFGTTMAEPSSPHAPSISDVFAVKDIFFSRFALPLEIIDGIIDLAEYWPCTSTVRAGGANNAGGQVSIRAGRPTTENQLIVSIQYHALCICSRANECIAEVIPTGIHTYQR